MPLETIDEHGPPTAAPPPIPVDEPLVATPSKDDKDKDKEERKKDSDGESKAEIKSSRPRHKNSTHVHKGASSEPSPRRQNSTPEMSPSLKESSGSAVQAEKIAQYERRVAELESLLDASRRHAQQLEKQLLQERQLAADMEALLNAANDMRAASAKFDAACKDIAQRRAGGKKGSDEHLKI